MKIGDFLAQIENCWLADSKAQPVLCGCGHDGLKKFVSEIPKSKIPAMVEKLEWTSFALKISKVALAVITAMAGYIALASLFTFPLIVSLLVSTIAAVITIDGARGVFVVSKVQNVIDAFCQKKRAANLPSIGATTAAERAEWSQKFKEAELEMSILGVTLFFGDEIPGAISPSSI